MYHPCHKLSVPSAKLFWCRHCMQMFEDAITRWRHSRTCKGSTAQNREKDLNGQVIQLYVKPDKVSYQQNNIPGKNIVNHKRQVKKNSAELKCMICKTSFLSLDEIREHVKYPCRRAYDNSSLLLDSGSDTENTENPVCMKIRRVESTAEPVVSKGTGLSVLAEASKHIESLLSKNNKPQNNHNNIGKLVKQEEKPLSIRHQAEIIKDEDIEPLVLVFQQDDGEIIPIDQLDSETVQNHIIEVAAGHPAGQIVQVQLGENRVQNYVKTPGGEVVPVEILSSSKLNSVIENSQKTELGDFYNGFSQVVQEQIEISTGGKPDQPSCTAGSKPQQPSILPVLKRADSASQTSVIGPAKSSLVKSSESQSFLLDSKITAVTTLQNLATTFQNLKNTGQTHSHSVAVSTETDHKGTSSDEIEEQAFFFEV